MNLPGDITEIASARSNLYLMGSVACAVVFSVLFYNRTDICHTAFPLTYSLVGFPLVGTVLGGVSFFDPKSGWMMVLAKIGVVFANLGQLGMGLISLTGLGLAQCG